MSQVQLHGIWINDAETTTDRLVLRKGGDFQPTTTTPGTQQLTAGGRLRGIIQGPQIGGWTLTAQWLTFDQCEWLRSHEGRLVWVRDWQGRRIHGWWLSTPIQTVAGRWGQVSLSIAEITPAAA